MSIEVIDVAAAPGVRACFTTRAGGVSSGVWAGLNLGAATGDDREAVRRNRRLLCAHLALDPERATIGHQVHGAQVRSIDAPTRPGRFTGGLSGWPDGDGLVTGRDGLGLVVLGADCLPVLLWRADGTRIGAAHAGWRGLVAGVLEAAARAVGPPGAVRAAIGPGVGPCHYPVDGTLRGRFRDRFGATTVAGDAVDLAAAARVALGEAGVTDPTAADACTACEPERFYSYRRDGAHTGRHAGVVVRVAA